MSGLSIHLLGQLKIEVDDEIVTEFESDKVRALLVYLVLEADRPHRRSALTGLLWPERPERSALSNLRGALSNLRKAIRDQDASPRFILSTRQTVQFNSESDHWIDAAEFAAVSHHGPEKIPSIRSLEEGLLLYQGPFLEGFTVKDSSAFEEWATFKREEIDRQLAIIYQSLVTQFEEAGDHEHALRHAWRWVEVDPFDENAHRRLMHLLAASGQRANALDHYETLNQILSQELDVEPSEETKRMYQMLLNEEHVLMSPTKPQVEAAPIHLPVQNTPFVGRNHELEQIESYLIDPSCRLITLTGPGGIGKTRIALQAADKFANLFADGVCFVSLESLTSANFLASATAAALKFVFYGPENQTSQLLNYLQVKEALLVLDNFEHLLEGVDFITAILEEDSQIKIIVTSRERLNLKGEWILDVGAMDYPTEDIREGLEGYDAVQLFMNSAQRVNPEFSLTEREVPFVIRICHLMQGLPLGIELSAAWLRTLSVDQIVEEIEEGLEFLSSSLRDIPERHRSLWAVFDHSWRMLSESEQVVFRRLSVFRGMFERKAASYVAGASLPMLSALVDKSLIGRNESGRYEIGTLLQQFARKHRIEAGEYESVRTRHRDWFMKLAEEVSYQLREHLWGTLDLELMDRIDAERDNLRIALQWSIDQNDAEEGLRLAVAQSWYWYVRADFSEGRNWLEQTLQLQDEGFLKIRALALHRLATFAVMQRDYPVCLELAEEGLQACYDTGQLREAGWSFYQLGLAEMQQGEFGKAAEYCQEAFDLFVQIGYEAGIASMQLYQGILAFYQGDIERAAALIEEGLPVLKEIEDHVAVARGMHGLGLITLYNDDLEKATSYFREGLSIALNISARLEMAQSLEGIASVACRMGEYQRSSVLFGFSENLRNTTGTRLSLPEQVDFDRCISEIRENLSEVDFSDGWEHGKTMSLEEAVTYTLG